VRRFAGIAVAVALVLPGASEAGWSKPEPLPRGELLAFSGAPSGRLGALIYGRRLGVSEARGARRFGGERAIPNGRIHELTTTDATLVFDGGRVAAWLDWDGTSRMIEPSTLEEYGCCDAVNASVRRADGSYGRARLLSARGGGAGTLDGTELNRGRTLLVWQLGDGRFQTAVSTRHGGFRRAVVIGRVAAGVTLLDVAPLRRERVLITYFQEVREHTVIRTMSGRPGHRFGAPATVGSLAGSPETIVVATDRRGGQLAGTSDGDRVAAYTRRPGGRFGRGKTLSNRGLTYLVDADVGPRGSGLVVWSRDHRGKTEFRYTLARRGKGFDASRALLRVPSRAAGFEPATGGVTLGRRGRMLAGLVLTGDGRGNGVYVSAGSLASGLGRPVHLSHNFSVETSNTRPVMDRGGRGAFAWQEDFYSVRVARFRP
jgi:hypothetical protein